jgi:F0F1-type ATP synthase membrane subunit b/b'
MFSPFLPRFSAPRTPPPEAFADDPPPPPHPTCLSSASAGLKDFMRYDNVNGEKAYARFPLPNKMDSTLHALGGILLNGLPTFFLIIILKFYLRAVFFKPLEEVLAKRAALTEGARQAAAASLAAADARIAEHQAAIQAARTKLFEEQEKRNRQFEAEQSAALQKAHEEAEATISKAQTEINAEVETARQALAASSDQLAEEIAASLLKGKAA